MTNTELLPCPFCGKNINHTESDDPQFYFECSDRVNCGIHFNIYCESEQQAFSRMNTRADKAAPVGNFRPDAYLDEKGRTVSIIKTDEDFKFGGFVGFDRAIPDGWTPLYRKQLPYPKQSAPVERIEGLAAAITLENDCLYMSPDEAKAHEIVLTAARAYLKLQGGD